jgi:hypothetical protein
LDEVLEPKKKRGRGRPPNNPEKKIEVNIVKGKKFVRRKAT